MRLRKAYISGAISGHPLDKVKEKFGEAKSQINRTNPYDIVYTPIEDSININLVGLHEHGTIDSETLWVGCMRNCISMLATCEVIYMLPDWKFSRGAKIEHELAVNLKLEIVYL